MKKASTALMIRKADGGGMRATLEELDS